MKKVTLAALTAAAIAASAVVPNLAYAAPATPHYKPLICMVFPKADACLPPKPMKPIKPVHHHAMKPMKPAKPMKPKKP